MHPVNALKSLVIRRLEELGLRKSQLASELGYRNTAKGLRRIDAVLNAELDEDLTRRVAKILRIPKAELDRALADQHARKEKERSVIQAAERAAFRRSLTLIRAWEPPSIRARQGWWLVCQIPIPSLDPGLPREDELEAVTHHYRRWLIERSTGPSAELSGFYYHRGYDHGFLFDRQATLLREDHHHVAPSQIYIIPTRHIDSSETTRIGETQRGTSEGDRHDQAQ